MKNTLRILTFALSGLAMTSLLRAGPPTAADVGDVESFGHAALYMGVATGSVELSPDPCTGPAPMPGDGSQCFQLAPAPAATTFNAEDICRIKLPKKATRTIIYPALNFFVNYQLNNTTGTFQPQGLFNFTAILTIQSDALLDPSIIDPATGLPANGKMSGQFSYVYRDDRSMQINDRQRQRITLVRVGNAGINKAALVAQGWPQSVIDAMFTGPMTVSMSMTGGARLATDANVTGNMRLFGD
jgi:hypothetical protein